MRLSRTTTALVCLIISVGCRGECPPPFNPDLSSPLDDVQDAAAGTEVATALELVLDNGQGETDAAKADVDWLLEEGRFWLVNAEPGFAFKFFKQALDVDPNNQDALFGAGLSEYVRSLELFAMVITLPGQFAGYLAGEGTRGEPESENDYLAEELRGIFKDLRAGFAVADGYLVQLDDPGFSWTIEGVPIYVLTRPVVVMRGRFDLADVYLIRSMNSFLLWSLDLLAAQDYHTDMLTAVYGAMEMEKGGVDIWAVLSIVSELMAYDSRFFTLHSEDGLALFEDGAQRMRDTGDLLLKAVELLSYWEEEGDGEVTTLKYNTKGDAVLWLSNRSDFDTGEEGPVDIVLPNELLDATENLLDAMDEPGQAVPFSLGPAVQLGTMFGILNRFGVLRFVPIEIPLPLDGLQPGEVTVLLSGFFADSIAFDYGSFFAKPVGLRSFFPLLRKTPEGDGADVFWMEWECLEETADTGFPLKGAGFLCSAAAELSDGPHHVGTTYEMEADNYPSPVPYMVWEDPTWGMLLAVDEDFLEHQGDPASFVVPDLFLTNLGVHQWLGPVLKLLR